jgi:hypothetical protein
LPPAGFNLAVEKSFLSAAITALPVAGLKLSVARLVLTFA